MSRPKKQAPAEQTETGLQPVDLKKKFELELLEENAKREVLRRQMESFNRLINRPPDPKKICDHDGAKFIPISIVEKDLAKCFFGLVQYEIISYQQILNEFVVHSRLRVFHPILNEWMNFDGIGCGMFQQKAGTPIQDFFMYKRKDGGKLTCPNAYAESIKNAAKKIGKRFGSDLNRSIEDNYKGFYAQEVTDEKPLN